MRISSFHLISIHWSVAFFCTTDAERDIHKSDEKSIVLGAKSLVSERTPGGTDDINIPIPTGDVPEDGKPLVFKVSMTVPTGTASQDGSTQHHHQEERNGQPLDCMGVAVDAEQNQSSIVNCHWDPSTKDITDFKWTRHAGEGKIEGTNEDANGRCFQLARKEGLCQPLMRRIDQYDVAQCCAPGCLWGENQEGCRSWHLVNAHDLAAKAESHMVETE